MRGLFFGLLDIVVILATLSGGVVVATGGPPTDAAGPYEGTFYGIARGDRNSYALISLDLTHRGDWVEGILTLSEGLYVDGGICGAVNLPAAEQTVEGQTETKTPGHLEASPTLDVGSFDLTVDFESDVSEEGSIITAEAKVDLPWFCGRDPVLAATLYRQLGNSVSTPMP
jgi:hypothetical protein